MYINNEENRIQAQINAIQSKLVKGLIKKPYAAKKKIESLKSQINSIKYYNFLAQ